MKTTKRRERRTAIGLVTSDKMSKTRRVQIPRLVKHPRYGKYIRRRTICHVHDEQNLSRQGDTVEIMESRPMSKMKHWRLVRVVTKSGTEVALKPAEVAIKPAVEQASAPPSGVTSEPEA